MKAMHSTDGLIRLQKWACSFDTRLPSLYLGRVLRWHYRPLQAHLKIIACMIAVFLTSLRGCSLCLGINSCSILDRRKAVSFHVWVKGYIFSTIHFGSVRHAVLIYWSSPLCTEWKEFRGVLHCCREQMHWLVPLSLSLSLCLLFIWFPCSVLWSEKPKRPQFCYFRMADSGD